MSKKYSILFDMDGVLFDSEPVILEAAIRGLKEYGVEAVADDFTPFIGAGEDMFIGGVATKHGKEYKLEMKKRVYEIYDDIVVDMIKVFDGVSELLERLNADDYTMVLASSADHCKIDSNLRAGNISPSFFKTIIGGEDIKYKKPAPDIYLKAAEHIGEFPEYCIVVEDSLNGIKAAKAAGMKCIAITSSFDKEILEKEEPDLICDKIDELLEAINNLH